MRSRPWPGPATEARDDVVVTPFVVADVVVRRWPLFVAMPLVAAFSAVLFALLFRDYSAKSRFVPQARTSELARFAGLAAQIGLPLGSEPAGASPDFYVDLVGSGEVLGPVALRTHTFARRPGSRDTLSGTYMTLLDIEGDSDEERFQNTLDRLRAEVSASASVKSGVITLRTSAPWPGLAESLNRGILEQLSGFDRERRQASARAERIFVEERLATARRDLEAAETDVARFLDRNKRPESARLMMELERLQRQVALRQQLYAALAQAHEQARIEEVRNTPVITIVDRPDGSARGSRRIRVLALIALLLGGVAATGLAVVLEWLDRRSDSPELTQLRASVRAMGRRRAAGSA